MSKKNNKTISVDEVLVVKKSPECRKVTYKSNASLSKEEAIAKHTIGELDEDIDDGEKE